MKPSKNGLTAAAVALATALGLSVAGPHRASAAPALPALQDDSAPAVTIISPTPRTLFGGDKPVEISAFYQGSTNNPISAIDLYVDGAKAATKTLDVPEGRGVVSFLIDASVLSNGTHRIVVHATAQDAQISSAKSSFKFQGAEPAPLAAPQSDAPAASDGKPSLQILRPTKDGKVSGLVTIRVKASDPSGKPPYVSFFVDKSFKSLKNYPPYDYEWDTTTLPNGYHVVEAFGYNDAQAVGQAEPMRVYINNPGGETLLRTDLTDAPKPAAPTRRPAKPMAKPIETPKPAVTAAKPIETPKPVVMAAKPVEKPKPTVIAAKPVETPKPTVMAAKPIETPKSTLMAAKPIETPRPTVMAAKPIETPKPTLSVPKPISEPVLATDPMENVASLPNPAMRIARSETPNKLGVDTPLATGLSSPFVPDLPAPKADAPKRVTSPRSAQSRATATTNRPGLAHTQAPIAALATAPTTACPEDPTLAIAPITEPRLAIPAGSVQMSRIDLSSGPLSLPVLAAPALPLPAATERRVNTVARVKKVAVIHPALAPKKAVKRIGTPLAISSRREMRLTRGQKVVIFNSNRLSLERPLTSKGSVMFGPIRRMFEYGGGSLTWESRAGVVHMRNSAKDVQIQVGSTQAKVNKSNVRMESAPYISRGRTMVPLSFLPAALDVTVHYDEATGHLLIKSTK